MHFLYLLAVATLNIRVSGRNSSLSLIPSGIHSVYKIKTVSEPQLPEDLAWSVGCTRGGGDKTDEHPTYTIPLHFKWRLSTIIPLPPSEREEVWWPVARLCVGEYS